MLVTSCECPLCPRAWLSILPLSRGGKGVWVAGGGGGLTFFLNQGSEGLESVRDFDKVQSLVEVGQDTNF